MNSDALFAEGFFQLSGNLFVFERHQARQHLEDRDLCAESLKHRGKLDPDGAPTDDDYRLRNFAQLEDFFIGQDRLGVCLETGQQFCLGARRQDNVPGCDLLGLGLASSVLQASVPTSGYAHTSRSGNAAPSAYRLNVVLFEQKFHALSEPGNNLALARKHGRPVHGKVVADEAVLFGFLETIVDFGVEEQSLGGNAPPMQAGAAELLRLFHERSLQPKMAGTDGCHVAARPAADHYHVKLRNVRQDRTPLYCAPRKAATRNLTLPAVSVTSSQGRQFVAEATIRETKYWM